jgi:glycosyltransferase involved in cell wall biosynthesis
MSDKKIIIWIPVFNEESYLATTIQSAVSQTYKNIHIIISDNYSTDSSKAIIDFFASRDDRIRVVSPPSHCPALEHIKFIHKVILDTEHDASLHMGGHDVLTPNYVERIVGTFCRYPMAALVVPNGARLSDDGKVEGYYPVFPQLRDTPTFTNPFVVFSSVGYMVPFYGLIPRHILERVSLRHVCYAADLLFIAEISLYGPVIVDESAVILSRAQVKNDSGSAGGQLKKSAGVDYDVSAAIDQYNYQLAWIKCIAEIGVKNFPWVSFEVYSAALMACYTARWAPIQFSHFPDGEAFSAWLQSPTGKCLGAGLIKISNELRNILPAEHSVT